MTNNSYTNSSYTNNTLVTKEYVDNIVCTDPILLRKIKNEKRKKLINEIINGNKS